MQIGVGAVNTASNELRVDFRRFRVSLPEPEEPGVASSAEGMGQEEPGGSETKAVTLDYDRPPRLVKQVRPRYPLDAARKGLQGTVLVEALIDGRGLVARTRVIEHVPALDEAAEECVRQWRFEPAVKDGRPVATIIRIPITFRILLPER